MFDELMLHSDKFTVKAPTSVAVDIRLPWYRSLPISCIERLTFVIDGTVIPPEKITVISDGIPYPALKLADLCDTQWFVLDTKQAILSLDAPLADGEHDVTMEMSLRVPYRDTNYGVAVDEKYIQFATCSKKLSV